MMATKAKPAVAKRAATLVKKGVPPVIAKKIAKTSTPKSAGGSKTGAARHTKKGKTGKFVKK